MRSTLLAAITSVILAVTAAAQTPWPSGKSPREIGRLVASRFASDLTHQNYGNPWPPGHITYPEVCTWYGALTFAELTGDEKLLARLARRFEPLLAPVEWPGHPAANHRGRVDERHLVPPPDHVDNTVFAAVPLELYLRTKEPRYLEVGLPMADWQWAAPDYGFPFRHPVLDRYFPDRATPEAWEWHRQGYSWQTRLWIDDMYMITLVQTQAFRATGEVRYLERAAREMVLYLERLQRPNGLFYHDPSAPFFWGRGNGWMAAGTAELLRALPTTNEHHAAILAGFRTMMATLLKHQAEDGLWRQLIDDPVSWGETSASAMFTFAFITGVDEGWLDRSLYEEAARKGWLALTGHIDANGDLAGVCRGTSVFDPAKHGPDGRKYYTLRERASGDLHGQAPILWCATAWLRAESRAPAIKH